MKKNMCEQLKVLKKIRKAGKINGFDMELAEAQAADYVSLRKRIDSIESDVSDIKTEQAVQGGKLDMLIKEVRAAQNDADRYRLLVDIWRALFGSVKKTVLTFLIVGIIIGFVNIRDVLDLLRSII